MFDFNLAELRGFVSLNVTLPFNGINYCTIKLSHLIVYPIYSLNFKVELVFDC